ncbi:MAG TPA: sulfatase-like hydrolase/transferase [Candidatus Acidoferrales bacterium]|nr:sulfatase-like hydrolase/transferase [Candidatus Acidoferrales bacterium]
MVPFPGAAIQPLASAGLGFASPRSGARTAITFETCENSPLRFTSVIFVLLVAAGHGQSPAPVGVYRLDDQFKSPAASSAAAPMAEMAAPIVWQNFLSEDDITWGLLRGRIGYRKGDLIVKGDGSTPVVVSPDAQPIDWTLYEAVEIRMLAEGGKEIKIRIGSAEFKQPIGPPGEYHDYRFDVNVGDVKVGGVRGSRPLAVMPTDSLTDPVAISSIKLVPRTASFPGAAGKLYFGKGEEYRNVLYAHAPSSLDFELPVPRDGRLHFGMGVTADGAPVTFRVQVSGKDLYSKTISTANTWEDADVDLSAYGGRNLKLALRTESSREGAVGLWANPLLSTRLPKARPNILIYVIDTLRADHTSLYGYKRDTTPFLKKLAATGVVFGDCQAQATWTKPSIASLLTSIYSYTHGIFNDSDTIPKGAATLAEQLRNAGYVTANIAASPWAGKITGLQRGFDYVMEFPVIQRHRTDTVDRATDSAAVNKVVFPWLERHRDEPFFLYAHATDPHAPYRPPAGFEEKFANPAETAEFNRDYASLRDQGQYGGGTVVSREGCKKNGIDPDKFIRRAVDRYDGEVLHNDANLELLVARLKQLGILDNTLIIVVSDHGEEFWDHGWTAHGHSLYQELTHCVFLMWNPKLLPGPRRVAEPVQLIDVMPTILDLLKLKAPDIVQGQSLLPLATGRPFHRRTPVVTSRFAHPSAKVNGFVPENRINTFALIEANWKLVYREKGKDAGLNRVELYDRRTDRAETNNVAGAHPQDVESMMAELGKWVDAQKQIRAVLGKGARSTLDQQTLDQLRSLGYIGGKQ